jgi:hypothetical protein
LLPHRASHELNKLAHNVSFGHGILSGIHWRSDSDSSMVLGEAVAISILQEKAQTFNEKFTVHFTSRGTACYCGPSKNTQDDTGRGHRTGPVGVCDAFECVDTVNYNRRNAHYG